MEQVEDGTLVTALRRRARRIHVAALLLGATLTGLVLACPA